MTTGLDDTRTKILDAAWRLLEEGGPARATMTRVARGAGVSRQAVYLHFGSRPGLLVALVEYVDGREGLVERLEWVMSAPSAPELLDRMAEFTARFSPKVAGLARALARVVNEDDAARAAWQNRMDSRMDCAREIATRLEAEGYLTPEVSGAEAIDMIYGMFSWELWWALTEQRGWGESEYAERMGRWLRRMLLRR